MKLIAALSFLISGASAFSPSAKVAKTTALKGGLNGWVPDSSAFAYGLPGTTNPIADFDPLGFTKGATLEKVKQLREAETQHGRIAMLAALGFLVTEEPIEFHPLFGAYNMDIGPAIDHLDQVRGVSPIFIELLAVLIGSLEINRALYVLQRRSKVNLSLTLNLKKGWKSLDEVSTSQELIDSYYPGDVGFDPLGLKPKDAAGFLEMSTKETNNGRLAMIGVAGMIAQELVNGKEIFVNAGLAADRFDLSSFRSEEPLAMIGVDMVAQELVNGKKIFDDAGLAADSFDPSSVGSEEPLAMIGEADTVAQELVNVKDAMIGEADTVAQELVNVKEIVVNAGLAADRFDLSSVNYAFFILPGLLLPILALANRQKPLDAENIDKENAGFSLFGLPSSESKTGTNEARRIASEKAAAAENLRIAAEEASGVAAKNVVVAEEMRKSYSPFNSSWKQKPVVVAETDNVEIAAEKVSEEMRKAYSFFNSSWKQKAVVVAEKDNVEIAAEKSATEMQKSYSPFNSSWKQNTVVVAEKGNVEIAGEKVAKPVVLRKSYSPFNSSWKQNTVVVAEKDNVEIAAGKVSKPEVLRKSYSPFNSSWKQKAVVVAEKDHVEIAAEKVAKPEVLRKSFSPFNSSWKQKAVVVAEKGNVEIAGEKVAKPEVLRKSFSPFNSSWKQNTVVVAEKDNVEIAAEKVANEMRKSYSPFNSSWKEKTVVLAFCIFFASGYF